MDSQSSPFSNLRRNSSEHFSQLGDSTSLFFPNTSLEESPLQPFKVEQIPYQFIGSRPHPANLFVFDQSQLPKERVSKASRSLNQNLSGLRKKPKAMVVEREPPKPAGKSPEKPSTPAFGNFKQPEFGKASPLQSRLHSNVFNIPKPRQPRPEHHRINENGDGVEFVQNNPDRSIWQQPAQPKPSHDLLNSAEVVEIPRPANLPSWRSRPPAVSTFSSLGPSIGGFSSVNPRDTIGKAVDLTSVHDPFGLDSALLNDKFGAADPYTYVDAGKATENIKALLEGAFEDDEDKPRTRSRKKKVESTLAGLAGKLEKLDVKLEHQEEHLDEEEEEDDGTIEGLNVKLLPHQVDGVEWMKDKEITMKKKNGVLPKGGILADDVCLSLF